MEDHEADDAPKSLSLGVYICNILKLRHQPGNKSSNIHVGDILDPNHDDLQVTHDKLELQNRTFPCSPGYFVWKEMDQN